MEHDPEQPNRLHICALQQLTEGPLFHYDSGWQPGYPSPSGDGRLAFANATILWLGFRGWARVMPTVATITVDGINALRQIEKSDHAAMRSIA